MTLIAINIYKVLTIALKMWNGLNVLRQSNAMSSRNKIDILNVCNVKVSRSPYPINIVMYKYQSLFKKKTNKKHGPLENIYIFRIQRTYQFLFLIYKAYFCIDIIIYNIQSIQGKPSCIDRIFLLY